MTDPLSTIRRDAEALYQIKKYGTANTPPHALRQSILAACDAIEAEREQLIHDRDFDSKFVLRGERIAELRERVKALEAERLTPEQHIPYLTNTADIAAIVRTINLIIDAIEELDGD